MGTSLVKPSKYIYIYSILPFYISGHSRLCYLSHLWILACSKLFYMDPSPLKTQIQTDRSRIQHSVCQSQTIKPKCLPFPGVISHIHQRKINKAKRKTERGIVWNSNSGFGCCRVTRWLSICLALMSFLCSAALNFCVLWVDSSEYLCLKKIVYTAHTYSTFE